jgi:hypothetical protein
MSEQRGKLAQFRTILVVTLIAVMLWLLAESRMVRTQTMEAQLVLTTSEPSNGIELVVRKTGGQDRTRSVELELDGSTAGIDRLIRQLQNRIELRLGREIPAKPGTFVIDLREELRRSSDLDMHGVTIKSVTPETVEVEVDELETRELPIGIELPEGVLTDGSPRAEPALVQVRAPSSVLAGIAEDSAAAVVIERSQLDRLSSGRLETVPDVVVQVKGLESNAWQTTIEPPQVDVLIELKSVTQQLELDPLPVQVVIAPNEIGKWRIELDGNDHDLIGVLVEGPVAGIEALRSGTQRPQALVILTFEDLERGVNEKPAQIVNLPAGCRVVGFERVVGLQITRVEPGTEPAESGSTPTP